LYLIGNRCRKWIILTILAIDTANTVAVAERQLEDRSGMEIYHKEIAYFKAGHKDKFKPGFQQDVPISN
jgi:hypothetical protein